MYPDYIQAVLQDYREKKAANVLPLDMMQLKPAKFKMACRVVCRERYTRKDERVLKAFFGEGIDQEVCLQAITRCDIDKFRPLINYLKESTSTTDDKNIELLAWMIDFKGRPWQIGWERNTNSSRNLGDRPNEQEDEAIVQTGKDAPKMSGPSQESNAPVLLLSARPIPKSDPKKLIAATVILAVLGFGAYWLRDNKSAMPTPTGPQACMFWAGDHYQPVSCSQKIENVQIIVLDSEKLAHFKKITRTDTITESALGSIWCVKFRGVYECYTSPGYHPIDTSLKLRLLTDYILIKHIHPNQGGDKTSQ
jgi:hypothetical protein